MDCKKEFQMENIEKSAEPNEESPLEPKIKEENEDKKTKLTISQRLKLIKDNITVEPILACYIMPSALSAMAIQNLNTEKACRVNLNFSSEICDALHVRDTENYTYYDNEVQKLMANVQSWKNIIQTAIPLVIILFVGAWSDKTGKRKVCILLPIVGELISCMGFIINTYYFYALPMEITAFTETIFPAIAGGWFTNYIGVFSYIGDITTVEERTYRVGLVNMFTTLGYPIGSALSGILLSVVGYYGIFSISAVLYLFSILYGIFYLEDPKRDVKRKNTKRGCCEVLGEFFDFKLVIETFSVAFTGTFNRRLRIILLLVAACAIFGPWYGEMAIVYLFTRLKFNWNEIEFSIWTSYCLIINTIGTMFAISVFTNYLKMDDTLLGIISCTSKIIASFGYAFSRNTLEIYLTPLIEFLNGASYIAMRSIASKLVRDEEFGKLNSLFALPEATMPLIYGPMYSRIYMETLEVMPGGVFFLGAISTLPAIAIFAWLYTQHKKDMLKTATVILDIEKRL